MTSRTLVLGGARSGKSAHAEGLVTGAVTYVATGRRDPSDAEWQARIAAHVARRPAEWATVESTDLPAVLDSVPGTVLVDDLATWLTGVLDDTGAWEGPVDEARVRCDELVDAVARRVDPLVLVSAEVGLGVVPATRSGRLFRDELGSLNARLAQACDEVLLLVAGLPLRLR
ncbi:bifunctional adenosylcobinamide kinase/adenosylcobinamide-phosphate guanylyltransferase [Kutzneria sp. NPDC051319]|uniref:bifunctional adenosylcobinamide kinase/adenosylcobinamide-phosphate guanylyltransferase n=1 Tax=Kutzneria sp. NPDC051319 TaxID=3155047 RepID=UPI00343E54FC